MKDEDKIETFEPPIFYEDIKKQVVKRLPLDKTKPIITKAIQNLSNLVPLVTEQQ